MTKNIKLIAIDMDGTLLDDRQEISDGNREAIREARDQGIHVVISTGRTRMSCGDLVAPLELGTYLITVNGSEIWDGEGNLLERQLLDLEHIEQMWSLKNKYETACWAATVDQVWRDPFPEDLSSHQWMKFGFDIEDDHIRNLILEELKKNKALEISNSSPTNLEINASGVNKAAAIEKVCERLGFTMENVMAMGDSLNDLAMIKAAGCGVAMGNAQQVVKDAADWVTETNLNDGVAVAIRKFALA